MCLTKNVMLVKISSHRWPADDGTELAEVLLFLFISYNQVHISINLCYVDMSVKQYHVTMSPVILSIISKGFIKIFFMTKSSVYIADEDIATGSEDDCQALFLGLEPFSKRSNT